MKPSACVTLVPIVFFESSIPAPPAHADRHRDHFARQRLQEEYANTSTKVGARDPKGRVIWMTGFSPAFAPAWGDSAARTVAANKHWPLSGAKSFWKPSWKSIADVYIIGRAVDKALGAELELDARNLGCCKIRKMIMRLLCGSTMCLCADETAAGSIRQGSHEPYDLDYPRASACQACGLEVCQVRCRAALPPPVLSHRARSLRERIEAAQAGADDYVKANLFTRRAHLRRQPSCPFPWARLITDLAVAGLHLDEAAMCRARGADIQLPPPNSVCCRYFMLPPWQFSPGDICRDISYDGETERDSNVLEVHVNHLRRKLGREVIETRRGQGYLFGGAERPACVMTAKACWWLWCVRPQGYSGSMSDVVRRLISDRFPGIIFVSTLPITTGVPVLCGTRNCPSSASACMTICNCGPRQRLLCCVDYRLGGR
ncbi:hypothetical protein FQR65_LT20213 [Abscondita terminalis]|nr:hypothetical protein FQR65_LT20213 [Abscondita terminalis]